MTPIRPWRIPLQLLLAVALLAGVASTPLAAAPGPLKGDAASTEVAGEEGEGPDVAQGEGEPAATSTSNTKLGYRVAAPVAEGDESTSSHRTAQAGRSAAGSAPEAEPRTQVIDPKTPVPETPVVASPPPRRASRSARRVELATAPYTIQESGRPRHSADSVLAYDGDPTTGWTSGEVSPMAYAWFDLGEVRPIAALRWYQRGAPGPVAVQVSNNREEWTTVVVHDQPTAGSWQQATIGEAARFVRIVISTEQGAADLAEVEIFGPPGSVPADPEPADTGVARVSQPIENRPPQVRITGGGEQGQQAAEAAVVVTPEPDSEAVEISVNGDVTRCTGGERCRVVSRPPEVVEDCGDGTTTCTIRIGVSAGVAVCDESGGNNGRNGGSGGRCSAEASGGTVEIGDVNR